MVANAWSAGDRNPTSKHQIARQLAAKGHRVLWMEGAGMRRPSVGSTADRGRIVQRCAAARRGAVRVLATETGGQVLAGAPLLIPLPGSRWVRELNGIHYGRVARAWARRLGFATPVLINYLPVLARCMRGWHGQAVYHCVDLWSGFDMYDSSLMAELDARCCRYADTVIASARDLFRRCQQHNRNTHLVMHGVDFDHFASALDTKQAPADLPAGPVVGFFGLLSEWLDQRLIETLADAVPEASVVLIGNHDVPVDRLRNKRNIRLLGPRPFADLPAYAARFDVGIIPFVVNDLTRAVNPIKLREMLAAGCPVVSTDLPEVAAVARAAGKEAVSIADSRDAFVSLVKHRLEHPATRAQRRSISAGMQGETWSAKVDEILKILDGE